VKRLFKLAEKAGDDDVMARFLVLFDRSLRRQAMKRHRHLWRTLPSRQAAETLRDQCLAEGYAASVHENTWQGGFSVSGYRTDDVIAMPDYTTMGRNPWSAKLKGQRLFSLATRRYLCRRAWRYFRKLGQTNPDRYVAAAATALKLYEDADVADGLALIDNWGLVHILFHHSSVLISKRNGWVPAAGKALAELQPAPIYEEQWQANPLLLLDLVKNARCRPVRQWAIFLVRRHAEAVLRGLASEELFALLAHDDPAVVGLAVEVIRAGGGTAAFDVNRLLDLLETPNPETLDILCGLLPIASVRRG
jgi:hypothetical protein